MPKVCTEVSTVTAEAFTLTPTNKNRTEGLPFLDWFDSMIGMTSAAYTQAAVDLALRINLLRANVTHIIPLSYRLQSAT